MAVRSVAVIATAVVLGALVRPLQAQDAGKGAVLLAAARGSIGGADKLATLTLTAHRVYEKSGTVLLRYRR